MASLTPIVDQDDTVLQQQLGQFLDVEGNTFESADVVEELNNLGITGANDVIFGDKSEFEAEDYANFSQWIPSFVKPDEPCEYCRYVQHPLSIVIGRTNDLCILVNTNNSFLPYWIENSPSRNDIHCTDDHAETRASNVI